MFVSQLPVDGDCCVSSGFGLATAVIWLGCSWKFIVERCRFVWVELVCIAVCVPWEMEMGFAYSLWLQW